jgi:hypothetical protein
MDRSLMFDIGSASDADSTDLLDAITAFRSKCATTTLRITDCERHEVQEVANYADAMALELRNPMPPFDSVRFFDEDHHYEVLNPATGLYERAVGSVTGFLHESFVEFDANTIAKRLTRSRYGEYVGKTKEQILEMWEFGAECGSAFHRLVEYVLNHPLDMPLRLYKSPLMHTVEMHYFFNFLQCEIVEKFDLLRTELRLSDWALSRKETTAEYRLMSDPTNGETSPDYPRDPVMHVLLPAVKLAGSADLLCHRRSAPPNVVQIWDWKRSKKIRTESYPTGMWGKGPCDRLADCNQSHYFLQLNTYRWLLEHNSTFVVERMVIAVFHPNNESYVLIEVPDLQPTVQRLMINRLRKTLDRIANSTDEEDIRYLNVINDYFDIL